MEISLERMPAESHSFKDVSYVKKRLLALHFIILNAEKNFNLKFVTIFYVAQSKYTD